LEKRGQGRSEWTLVRGLSRLNGIRPTRDPDHRPETVALHDQLVGFRAIGRRYGPCPNLLPRTGCGQSGVRTAQAQKPRLRSRALEPKFSPILTRTPPLGQRGAFPRRGEAIKGSGRSGAPKKCWASLRTNSLSPLATFRYWIMLQKLDPNEHDKA